MSFYSIAFGEHESATILLGMLGKDKDDFGRYRDVYITDQHIVVHTRCGGNNRRDYKGVFKEMRAHPLFSHEHDEDYDCTYCNFYFKHPDEYSELLKEMAKEKITPSEKWKILLEKLK
jgi:hypothetical protein